MADYWSGTPVWKKGRRVDLGEWKATDYQQMERKPAKRKQ